MEFQKTSCYRFSRNVIDQFLSSYGCQRSNLRENLKNNTRSDVANYPTSTSNTLSRYNPILPPQPLRTSPANATLRPQPPKRCRKKKKRKRWRRCHGFTVWSIRFVRSKFRLIRQGNAAVAVYVVCNRGRDQSRGNKERSETGWCTHSRRHARWYGRGDRPTEIKSTSGGARGDQGPRICCCWQGEAGEPAGESHLSAHASSYPFPPRSLPRSPVVSPVLFLSSSLYYSLYRSPGPALVVLRATPRPWGMNAISSFFPTFLFHSPHLCLFLCALVFPLVPLANASKRRAPSRSTRYPASLVNPAYVGIGHREQRRRGSHLDGVRATVLGLWFTIWLQRMSVLTNSRFAERNI